MPTLTLIRGVPGSGKSTLAMSIGAFGNKRLPVLLEADLFFVNPKTGVYEYDKTRIGEAHAWCQQETYVALESSRDVVVSNTFTRIWEMQPYLDMAKELGCDLQVIECHGRFKNVHGCPEETVQRMRERFERYAPENS